MISCRIGSLYQIGLILAGEKLYAYAMALYRMEIAE